MKRLNPELLLQQTRSRLIDVEYYGYIAHCDSNKKITTFGDTDDYPFFHRSCAKPMQASLLVDYATKDFYNLSQEEIALCCASHAGEPCHIEVLKGLLEKIKINESDLQCPIIEPLSFEEQKRLNGNYSPLHNNCSGKHILMLGICKQNSWDMKTYLDKNHPLQIAIHKRIKELCEADYEMPSTLDGCMAPVWATTLEDLTKGFWNLFSDDRYKDIKNAFMNNHHLIGGYGRLDSQVMKMNQKLIAKVGANGLCCVFNTDNNEALSCKIFETDRYARSITVIETLIHIGWLDINSIDEKLLNISLDKYVKTETGEIVGEYVFNAEAVSKIKTATRKF